MTKKKFYFDNATTSFPKPDEVWKAIRDYQLNIGSSPGHSTSSLAKEGQNIVDEARRLLAEMFHVANKNLIAFTNNATSGLNYVLKGFLQDNDHVICTNLEHSSILRPLETMKRNNQITYSVVYSNNFGEFNLSDFEKLILPSTKLIAINHGSNVLGTKAPIKEVFQIAKKHHIKILVDASQTAGIEDIDIEELDIDFLVFTGHKSLLGPSGTGGFYVKDPFNLSSIIQGGTGTQSQFLTHPELPPTRFEPGTLNYLGIAGLRASLLFLLKNGVKSLKKRKMDLTEYLINKLLEIKEIIVYGPTQSFKNKLPLFSFNFKDLLPSEAAYIFDHKYNIIIKNGLHCAPLVHKTLNTLPFGTLRFSLGYANTKEEIDYFIDSIKQILQHSCKTL